MLRAAIVVLLVLAAAPCFAQQGVGNDCTPAGTWYGGSVVTYQMTIVPSVPAGTYTVVAQGMYKNAVLNTVYTGTLTKKGDVYEGPLMQLSTTDPDFTVSVPPPSMPNVGAGWTSIRMEGCNSIKNTIPFFGLYFSTSIWELGPAGIVFKAKVPLVDAPDVDLLDVLAGGFPIVEFYRRLPNSVNPALLHK